MPDYFAEESPWAQPLTDTGFSTFDTPDDVTSPWSGGLDKGTVEDEDTTSRNSQEEMNPYGAEDTPYGDTNTPLVSNDLGSSSILADTRNGVNKYSEPVTSVTESVTESGTESVPELKPQSHKSKTQRKKRAGGTVKVESVASDPLAASTAQLDTVSLTSDSVANLNLNRSSSLIPNDSRSLPNWSSDQQPADASSAPPRNDNESSSLSFSQPEPTTKFEIQVGDPCTVGDLTNAHTEYTIQMTTDSEHYEHKESAVQRRYRDFRWLYRTLEHKYPGVVVPPPPDKQALGRFNDDFVQQRRAALEQMLRKITRHPLLLDDSDLKEFLTSNDFSEYLKRRLLADEGLEHATRTALSQTDSGRGNPWYIDSNSGASGFIGSLSASLSLSKGTEIDPWTLEKRSKLDASEFQLREVCKDLVSISIHRKQLSDSIAGFANVIRALSEIEATRRLSGVLRAFAKVHDRLSQIYLRQRQQNLLTLEATLDEHLRTIGSIRDALAARQKVFSSAENASSEVEKRQLALDKLLRQNRTQEDRQKALEEDIEELAQTASKLHQQAANIAHLVDSEITRVNGEKIEDIRNSVEIYLETTVEAQKESIEIWETFYSQHFAS